MDEMGDESGDRAWSTEGIENTGFKPTEPFELHQSDEHHESEGSFPSILDLELKIGTKVASEEEAYELYNRYAINMGFSIRKGNKRLVNGVIRQREFLCSKEGEKNSNKDAPAQRNHLSTRTNCMARVRFTITDNIWEITHINDMHNHEFATQEEKRNLRSGRKVLDSHAAIMTSMYCVGIKPNQSFKYLARQVGGVNNVGFTKRDCYNFLQTIKENMIGAGDGQSVYEHFKQKQMEDPLFFYSVQVNQHGQMTNFFWRDGRSKVDYDFFGDVMVFDTTYRTNKYNLICAPFVGINHHWKNILFGCAFLSDETTESFIWLFQTFLDAMGGRQPKCIFTDQDQAMANAIQIVLPDSCHRLCLWHLTVNAKKHLAGLYGNPSFKAMFHKCLSGCYSIDEFQSTWEDMITTYNLESNKWLTRLYDARERWSTAFSVDIFSARMKSTQRSESTNNVFHQILGLCLPLVEVIKHYEEKAKDMRQVEQDDDFLCKNGSLADFVAKGGILGHAANVYTVKLFMMFKDELFESLGLNCLEIEDDGQVVTYTLNKDGKRYFSVKLDRLDLKICCNCKLFEILGLLCCHCLRVLLMNNIHSIPDLYILPRWTKCAKERAIFSSLEPSNDQTSTRALRASELNHIGHIIFNKASLTPRGTQIVKDKLKEALILVENELECNLGGSTTNYSNEGVEVYDPPHIRLKGLTNARIRCQFEKKKKRKHGSQATHVSSMKENMQPITSQSGVKKKQNVAARQPSQNNIAN